MEITITASDLRHGDKFTYGNWTYTVRAIEEQADGSLNLYVVDSPYHMGFYGDTPVELIERGDGCRCEFQSGLCDACAARHAAPARPAAPQLTSEMAELVRAAERRVEFIKRSPHVADDYERMIHFVDPDGRTRKSRYTTEKGFLTAYAREARRGSYIIFAD